jgi:ABC-type bacteriocin/lantibiotic exporter with double-glycine peptidase domain
MREADVLILDEPTAALDARSEYEVFRRFKELSEGKTAILISHRFSPFFERPHGGPHPRACRRQSGSAWDP